MKSYEEVIQYKQVCVVRKVVRDGFEWVEDMDDCVGGIFNVICDEDAGEYYEPYTSDRITYRRVLNPWHAVLLNTKEDTGDVFYFLPESLEPVYNIKYEQMVFDWK